MDLRGKVINFLGDSITEGKGATTPDKCYVGLFASAHPECVVNNYGIGGTRIAPQRTPSAKPRHDLDFIGRVKELDERADLVCVFGSTNDYGHGDAPFGAFGDETPDTFCGALRTLTKKLLERFAGKKIAVFTPLHRAGEENGAPLSPDKRPLKDYVAEVVKNAEHFGLPVLDLWNAGIAVDELNFVDGLHPSDYGYQRLFSLVDDFIKSL